MLHYGALCPIGMVVSDKENIFVMSLITDFTISNIGFLELDLEELPESALETCPCGPTSAECELKPIN